ncbi:MAG: formate dehydrogenase accessory protein FdhE [Planctomycetota bacterium]
MTYGSKPPLEVVRRLESLLGRESISEDYVRLRIGVLRAQAAVLDELALRPATASMETAQGRRPALHPDDVSIDGELALGLLASIGDVCRRVGTAGKACGELLRVAREQPDLLARLIRSAALGLDDAGIEPRVGPLDIPPDLLVFLARVVAAPFVTSAAGRLPNEGPVTVDADGYCPICGAAPGLASLRADDGRRELHCSLCAAARTFARLACPFCGNQDPSTLIRLAIDGEDSRWIEACDACRRYLVTIDRQRLADSGELVPLVEEVAGVHLDLVAEREGYSRKLPYAAVG